MGAHKGRKWKDKPANLRYWTLDFQGRTQRERNKARRILKCNGAKFLKLWEQR